MALSIGSNKVSVILVNLNQEVHTRECIQSLLNVSHGNLEIILVDNHSSDGSGERLRREFPTIVFLQNEDNLGFAEGNNIGVREALRRGADYVMLLNNDTIVEKNFIEPLLKLAISDPAIGVQSCKIYFFSKPNTFWYAGGILDVDKAMGSHKGMHEIDTGRYDKIEDTGFATGCMMFIPRAVLEKVGLLDSSFFIYSEDSDWCERARQLGYRVVFNPQAKLWHKVSITTRIDSPFYLYFTMRNKILFLRKHARWWKIFIYLPYFLYFFGRHLIRMSLKWHSYIGTRAVILGIIDGLRNYTGECGKGRIAAVLQNK
jgi:GT2 family glycosyltransferase